MAVDERVLLVRAGAPALKLPLHQIVTSWPHLFEILLAALPAACYLRGRALVRFEQTADSVEARFADGTLIEGDLLIAADGINSTVRSIVAPASKPEYAGYIAWRGLVRESEMTSGTHRAIGDRFAFYLPPGEEILGYPVSGPGNSLLPGSRYYNVVWYRGADEHRELARILTGKDGIRHELSIPPNLIRDEVIAEMRGDAQRLLPPPFAEAIRLAPQPFVQAIYEIESPRLVFGRVVLIGDAAFVARPHAGAGVTKAAGDALALVRELSAAPDHLEQALQAFEGQRLNFGAIVTHHSRTLGHLLRTRPPIDPPLDDAARQLLALTAVAPAAQSG
ncbi:MAG: FAD-dependent monooxygenase [Candidatus Binataceae bacterium]|nr:FAD-dependent monooxygenase [Candidatus Binataceae bacterium]